jgi:hypothetical protein
MLGSEAGNCVSSKVISGCSGLKARPNQGLAAKLFEGFSL